MSGDRIALSGVIGLYLFAGTAVLSISGATLAAAIMLLAWCLSLPRIWRHIRSDPVFWIVLICLAYVLCSAWLAAHRLPETAAWQWNQAGKWAWLALLPVVAWWLRSDPRCFHIAFALFAAGAFLRMLLNTPWDHLGDLVTGAYRMWGFGLWHISFSSYLAVILLGIMLFSRRLLIATGPGVRRWFVVAGILAALLVCGAGIIAGKSRGTWLAMAVVFPVIVLAYLYSIRRQGYGMPWKSLALGGGVLALVLAVGLASGLEHVSERLFAEQETYERLLEGDVSRVPLSSVGVRIHLYKHGFERWLERPVFGWGTGSEVYLIESTGLFTGHYRPPHFHNIVLEILVRFGLVGLLLISAVLWLICRDIWRAYRDGRLPADWFYFFVGILVFSLVWGMADIRVVKWDYRNFTLLFLGAAYALTRYHGDERFFARINDRSAPVG